MRKAWKVVRGPCIVEIGFTNDDVIGPDPEGIRGAIVLKRALVLRGGGRSIADTRIRYVKGRYVYPEPPNPKAQWHHGKPGIYVFTRRNLAERFCGKGLGGWPS